ncbi:MAG TPA: hypothetical protein VHP58_00400 [Alphaproteobacteria bacterium]|nr:hypothetical protein [Alphaproteobacteria bacterium]
MHQATAFYGDHGVKRTFLDRIAEARQYNLLRQGQPQVSDMPLEAGEPGCAITITVGSYSPWHYATELGVPIWVPIMHEFLFEHVTPDLSGEVAELFLQSIPPGLTEDAFNRIFCRFMAAQLVDPTHGLSMFGPFTAQAHGAIKNIGALFLRGMSGQRIDAIEWQEMLTLVGQCPAPPESAACNAMSALASIVKAGLSRNAADTGVALHMLLDLHPGEKARRGQAMWMAQTLTGLFAKGEKATVASNRRLEPA